MSKSPINIVNRTNYFNPDISKVSLQILSPEMYRSKFIKQQSYQVRLYYEYLDTIKKGGQVFFYTLTYNNKSIPKYEGINCFDYKDLTYLLNGGFKKILNRRYHTRLKYFVGAELGEGAGKRGFENNPHYHVLFFLSPLDDDYNVISPIQFRHYVRYYWQGFDQDEGFHSFKYAKFGIAKEGDNFGKVLSYDACLYCSKYVTKDVFLHKFELTLKSRLRKRYFSQIFNSELTYNNFYISEVLPRFDCYDLPSPSDCYFMEHNTLKYVAPKLYKYSCCVAVKNVHLFFKYFLDETNLTSDYYDYVNHLVDEAIRFDINLFRNRYSNKCRISHGVGISALDDIDIDNPLVVIPGGPSGIRVLPICLYYQRKLFYDIHKDELGNNIYVLNQKGIDFKVRQLPFKMVNLVDRVSSLVQSINCELYNDISKSQWLHSSFDNFMSFCCSENIELYAAYKFIYEGRFFKYPLELQFVNDYRRFIQPSYLCSDYNPSGVKSFFDLNTDYSSYDVHPVFEKLIYFFHDIDSILMYFLISNDDKIESDYNMSKRIKEYFAKAKFLNYISNI